MTSSEQPADTSMAELRFNVFGTFVAVARTSAGWQAYLLSEDGKRRPADFVVPPFVTEDDVGQYLGDLMHESATPTNNRIVRLA